MFTVQEDLKQAGVLRTYRPQGTIAPFGGDGLTDTVQQLIRGCCQADHGKRSQIAGVRSPAQLGTATNIGNTSAQPHPFQLSAQTFPSYAETVRIVNSCLDPQYAPLLVVHFDRVLFNPVFDSDPFYPSFHVAADFASKTFFRTALPKAHYFFTAELEHGMPQQQRIKLRQTRRTIKHDVGGILHLPGAPKVTTDIQPRARVDPGIHSLSKRIEKTLPVAHRQMIHQFLRSLGIGDLSEAVVALNVADICSIQLSCQPFTTIQTNLHGERQPSLQTYVHQPKLPIQIVKVKVQALTFLRDQFQLFGPAVLPQIKRLTRFHTRKHANQTLLNAIALHDLQSLLLFRIFRRRQINIRSSQFSRLLFRVLNHSFRQTQHITAKVFHQHALAVQKNLQTLNMGYRTQGTAEQHAIKSFKGSSYAVAVPLKKTLHDSPLIDCLLVQTDHARKRVMKRSYFGCGLGRAM